MACCWELLQKFRRIGCEDVASLISRKALRISLGDLDYEILRREKTSDAHGVVSIHMLYTSDKGSPLNRLAVTILLHLFKLETNVLTCDDDLDMEGLLSMAPRGSVYFVKLFREDSEFLTPVRILDYPFDEFREDFPCFLRTHLPSEKLIEEGEFSHWSEPMVLVGYPECKRLSELRKNAKAMSMLKTHASVEQVLVDAALRLLWGKDYPSLSDWARFFSWGAPEKPEEPEESEKVGLGEAAMTRTVLQPAS